MSESRLFEAVDAAQELRRLRRALAEEGVPEDDLRPFDRLLSVVLDDVHAHDAAERLTKAACKLAAVAMSNDKDMIADDALDVARSAAFSADETGDDD